MNDERGTMNAERYGATVNTERKASRHGVRSSFIIRRSSFEWDYRPLAAALAVASALVLGGCDYLPFGYTSVKEITAAPASFEGKEVKVKGKVKGSLKLLGMKAFTLQDDTGEIAVSTAGELPAAGSDVAVKGNVRSAAIVGGSAMGLRVEETKRLR